MRKLIDADEAAIRAALRDRWSDAPRWTRRLVKLATAGTSPRLLHGSLGTFLRIDIGGPGTTHPESIWPEYQEENWSLYLPPPPTRTALNRALASIGFAADSQLAKFAAAFAGMRDVDPPNCGEFEPVDLWKTVAQDRERDRHSWFREWDGERLEAWGAAMILFTALNGDMILHHPDGPTGWFSHDQDEQRADWPDLKSFVAHYTEYHEATGFPFDCYSSEAYPKQP